MRQTLKLSFLLSVLLPCVGCDQATKSVARKLLTSSDSTTFLNGFIRFDYAENPGAFLGLGAQLPGFFRLILFVIFTGTMLVVLLLVMRKSAGSPRQLVGLALVAGGGIGNLIDRIINEGRVVDFISVGLGPVRAGIFNVADVAVMTGAMLLLYGVLGMRKSCRAANDSQ